MSSPRPRRYLECIYCRIKLGEEQDGRTLLKSDFSDEHVIGEAIGGREKLLKAGCPRCRDLTSTDERICFRGMFDKARDFEGFTRSDGTPPRTIQPVLAIKGTSLKGHAVPTESLPTIAPFPIWGPPNILCGKEPWDNSGVPKDGRYIPLRTSRAEDLRKELGADELLVIHQMDNAAFARMLAKIGHCFTVQKRGIEAFEPLLYPVISRQAVNWYNWVGMSPNRARTPGTHQLKIFEEDVFGELVYVVQIGLFSGYDRAVLYWVVTGRVKG